MDRGTAELIAELMDDLCKVRADQAVDPCNDAGSVNPDREAEEIKGKIVGLLAGEITYKDLPITSKPSGWPTSTG